MSWWCFEYGGPSGVTSQPSNEVNEVMESVDSKFKFYHLPEEGCCFTWQKSVLSVGYSTVHMGSYPSTSESERPSI
jgi:hypothetical protein